MERKDYEQKFKSIKNEILVEIRELVPKGTAHHFKEKFYVHYVEGEVATTEICSAVEVRESGMVVFIVQSVILPEYEVIEGVTVFGYSSDSFINILFTLKKDLREKKLSHLRQIIKDAGGAVNFDGSFGFNSLVDDNHVAGEKSMVIYMELDDTYENRVYIGCKMFGETMEEQEENIPFDQLDALIDYVERQIKKKFSIKVFGSFSRCFDIEAASYEEAEKLAKEEWRTNPLCNADSNGENWCVHQNNEE